MGDIAKILSQSIVGSAFDSPKILSNYSSDHSSLTITPQVVVVPETTEDVQKIVRYVQEQKSKDPSLSLTIRDSGLNETGADLGDSILLSTEKLDRLLDINARERLVRVQPGITLKELNRVLSVYGLTIPVAKHDHETIGELISNSATDLYAGKYHGIATYIKQIEVVLSSGDCLNTRSLNKYQLQQKIKKADYEGHIYQAIDNLLTTKDDSIKKILKDSIGNYGYPKIAYLKHKNKINLLPLFFGAENTLGIITEIVLKAIPMPNSPKRALASFVQFHTAKKFLELVSSLNPRRLEIYDTAIIKNAKDLGKTIAENPQSRFIIFAEFDQRKKASLHKISTLSETLPSSTELLLEDAKTKATFDEFEILVNSFLDYAESRERIPMLTNLYIPNWNLSSFINDLELVEDTLDINLSLYGSFSTSNYNLCLNSDMKDRISSHDLDRLLHAVSYILKRQGGTIAGGSSEGRTKLPITDPELTTVEREIYTIVKNIFDPQNIFSPDLKIIIPNDNKASVNTLPKEAIVEKPEPAEASHLQPAPVQTTAIDTPQLQNTPTQTTPTQVAPAQATMQPQAQPVNTPQPQPTKILEPKPTPKPTPEPMPIIV